MEPLSEVTDEFVIVVGYLGDQIQTAIGNEFRGIPVKYIWQHELRGTLDAFRLGLSEADSNSNVLVSNSDDIHHPNTYNEFLASVVNQPDIARISAHILEDKERLQKFGVFDVDADGNLIQIVEKPAEFISNLVNTALYYFPAKIRNFVPNPNLNLKEEYITDHLINPYLESNRIIVQPSQHYWFPVNSLHELEIATNSNIII
ncbi:MAG: hypothetical protein OHK0017_01050 [Patescibacteria group bacterium]